MKPQAVYKTIKCYQFNDTERPQPCFKITKSNI